MKKIILAGAIFSTVLASAQKGIGTNSPSRSAALELKSSKRGLLVPRVTLEARNVADPIAAGPVNSLLVYNIATAGTGENKVTPGYYYWSQDDLVWLRLINDVNLAEANPFRVNVQTESTVTEATKKRVVEDTDGYLADTLQQYPNALIIKITGGEKVVFPDAALYPGRVFTISNFSAYDKPVEGMASPNNFIRHDSNFMMWSDGENWWSIAGRMQ